LTPEQNLKLNLAKSLALDKLATLQQCRDLFQSLNRTNGANVINSTDYRDYSSHSKCATAPAWTVPNWLRVYMCSSFVNISANERAATVIHEALHSAGKLESPPYDGQMTSAQIQQLVKDKCQL
ncbi:MAG TPA: hypothetical protein VKU40_03685, partial [Thermoanaerobaculia bacterium]|nr:hypothetical protein [Thermoanaerobaculia bacterium]